MSEIDAIVSKANRLHESRFQAFRFHAPNPAGLHIKCGLPIQAVRIELPRKACLHVHSVSFVDSTGARLKASVANVQASSNYDNADGAAWLARIVEPDGAHPFAVHTLADSNPWIQLNLAEPISAAAIVIRNRAGRTARRTVGLSVSVLVDGAWTIVYDDESEFRRFVSEVAGHRHETGSDPDLLRGVAEVACSAIAYRYDGIQRVLDAQALAPGQVAELKRAINERVLRVRELEWTSHGVRRSFRFWSRKEQEDYVALAVKVCEDLGSVSDDVCFGFGSVLAIVREGGLIQHDDDLDIIVAFDKSKVEGIKAALGVVRECLVAKGYKVQGNFFSHWHVLRGGRKVDVFVGLVEEGQIGWFPGRRRAFRKEEVFPAGTAEFLGSTCPVPRDVERYLSETYGANWRTPAPGWRHDWDRGAYLDLV
jgi:hypothetical protein